MDAVPRGLEPEGKHGMLIGSLKRRASRLVNATLEIMTRFGVRVNSPVIVALAFRLGFRMRGPLRSSLGRKDKVVVLTKPGGLEDIFQAFAEPPERFSLVLFNRRLLRAVSDHFLGAGLDDWVYNADDDPANRERSLRYREFLTRVVGLLPGSAMLSASSSSTVSMSRRGSLPIPVASMASSL